MHNFIFLFACAPFAPLSNGVPVLPPGHLNAHAKDAGSAVVDIGKDVVLSAGKGGHNFNAESESNGQAVVTIGGAVHGSGANRTGEEFNAVSKTNGTSQVRVNGDLLVENLHPNTKKFDAISASGGQSVVQVGNVQIISASRGAKAVAEKKHGHKHLGPAWGAAAVAEHNSRPWEELGSDAVPVGDPPSSVIAHESDLFQNNPHSGGLEVHDFPHQHISPGLDSSHSNISIITEGLPLDEEHGHQHPVGSLNADSTGQGSQSIVNVKGSVVA